MFTQARRSLNLLCVLMALRAYYYLVTIRSLEPAGRQLVWWFAILDLAIILGALISLKSEPVNLLCTAGPYWFVGHPAYMAYLMLDSIFWLLGSLSWYSAVTGIAFWLVVILTAYLEERMIIERLGEEAKKYYHSRLSVNYLLLRIRGQ